MRELRHSSTRIYAVKVTNIPGGTQDTEAPTRNEDEEISSVQGDNQNYDLTCA